MALTTITSPHAHTPQQVGWVMEQVLLATLPGVIALTWYFGWGSLINVAIAGITAVACEAAIVSLRGRPVAFYLKDYSALVTAVLLGLALPPLSPWWLVIMGTAFAVVIAKHLYGGLGYNPFNPAMVGYVVLLISFPVEMTTWPVARPLLPEGAHIPGLWESLQLVLSLPGGTGVDAVTGATPLDTFKHNTGLVVEQLYERHTMFSQGELAGVGWEWVNLGFLAGGVYLLYRKIFTWHAPVGLLGALALMAMIFYDGGSSASKGSPILHLFSGGAMLGAFFIITDPVTSATSNRGRLIYGALAGVLIFVIRAWGNYPDAVAFAVLLMNFAAPFIDFYTVPRTYGHDKARRATEKRE